MNRNDLNLENLTHSPRSLLVCHGKSCRKLGAAKVLAAFQAHSIESVKITASSCLGQCGNGVMVLVLPEEIWYWRVQPDEVTTIIDRHLNHGIPIKSMLYPKFHPRR
jgi:(2Fe-2S) ferredoxin